MIHSVSLMSVLVAGGQGSDLHLKKHKAGFLLWWWERRRGCYGPGHVLSESVEAMDA